MAERSAYEILGVAREASFAEIRAAYRARAKALHPDHRGPEATDASGFLALTAAYQLLVDPAKRQAYDRDPSGRLEAEIHAEARRNQLRRRKRRLRRLWE